MQVLSIVLALLFSLPGLAFSISLPETGQTKCYNGTQEITCPNPGEDYYGQDAQYITLPQSYTKLDPDGNDLPDDAPWPWAMVRDNVTGLIWEVKTYDGSIHDKDNTYNWQDAQNVFIATLNSQIFGGCADWRLPTVKDLTYIVKRDTYNPSINTTYFPNTISSYYWSSTSDAEYQGVTWLVSFNEGDVISMANYFIYYVRAVCGGQGESLDHFIDNGDGTVSDMETGLMWQKGTVCCLNPWQQALAYCENLVLAGHDDWRLPNINELQSIVDYAQYEPSINTAYFPDTYGFYWSSTTNPNLQNRAFSIYFDNGQMGSGYKHYFEWNVRAVRGGQCSPLYDLDCDTIADENDNCLNVANPNQEDAYPPQGNGIGDACDCEGDFLCDGDVDGSDASTFKADFGRSVMVNPCIDGDTCNGDFNCDGDVDGTDASLFKQDFGRSSIQNPCPGCVQGEWCGY
jgi:hypothetical protein